MINAKSIVGLLLSVIFLSSCNPVWMGETPSSNNQDMFEQMWEDINNNYVFFDQKNVNWDEVRTSYLPDIQSDMSDEHLFEIFSNALSELKDGHVSLYSGFNTWNYHELYLNYPENFNSDFVDRTYLNGLNTIGPFTYDILEGNIAYLRYSSFGDDFTDAQLKYLVGYFGEVEGLIIDVRGNLGGAADNVLQLQSIFISDKKIVGKTHTPEKGVLVETEITASPNETAGFLDKEIVLLTNRKCYSSCNVFVGFMSTLPNVTIVGDTTGGGTGLAVASELANGWKYRYSGAKISLADNTEFENGFMPDIPVSTGPENELDGRDELMEKAIDLLK